MEDFVDRESQFPNRRRLQIVSQTPNEIIADIYREEGIVEAEGTPINATTLNAFKEELADWKNLVTTNGTVTYIGENKASEVSFTSDPQTQINNKANRNLSNVIYPHIIYDNILTDSVNVLEIEGFDLRKGEILELDVVCVLASNADLCIRVNGLNSNYYMFGLANYGSDTVTNNSGFNSGFWKAGYGNTNGLFMGNTTISITSDGHGIYNTTANSTTNYNGNNRRFGGYVDLNKEYIDKIALSFTSGDIPSGTHIRISKKVKN